MKVVVDTNIIFSATLSKNSKFREILSNKNIDFYAPYVLYDELINNLDKISLYSKESSSEVINFILKVIQRINFVHLDLIPVEIYKKAYEYCKDYDEEDTPFVALSLHMDSLLWTGDKIKVHLKKKGFDRFFIY